MPWGIYWPRPSDEVRGTFPRIDDMTTQPSKSESEPTIVHPKDGELLPCPFCGSPAAFEHDNNSMGQWRVFCRDNQDEAGCAIAMTNSDGYPRRVDAATAWNKRAGTSAQKGGASEALAFYAEPKNWQSPSSGFALQYDPEPSPIDKDRGERARVAIGSVTPQGRNDTSTPSEG